MPTRKAAAKTDPFADDDPPFEPDEAQTDTPNTPQKENTVVADPINEVSVTLKGGTGFDAPWVVVRASSPEEALELLCDDQVIKDLLDKAADRGAYFASKAPAKPAASGGGGNSGGGRSNPAAAAQEHPEGKTAFCEHGKMKYKAGISQRTGNSYKMFVCDGDVPRDQQCKPQNG